MTGCVFCAIVGGEVEASFVHVDDDIVAILDVNPVGPGHLLIIPVQHYAAITDLPLALGTKMWEFGYRVARRVLQASPNTQGLNFLMSEGVAAQQSIAHSHLHVIPRAPGDGMVLTSPGRIVTRHDLDAQAAMLRQRLGADEE